MYGLQIIWVYYVIQYFSHNSFHMYRKFWQNWNCICLLHLHQNCHLDHLFYYFFNFQSHLQLLKNSCSSFPFFHFHLRSQQLDLFALFRQIQKHLKGGFAIQNLLLVKEFLLLQVNFIKLLLRNLLEVYCLQSIYWFIKIILKICKFQLFVRLEIISNENFINHVIKSNRVFQILISSFILYIFIQF
ncbi:hypothetical protein IMG5_083130 [Ichthyophthirius multifiliis]|uniref:Uncharacterized protein n=1 Tax=Ichthyophthirius multifiliis TaxID=5932 RepID=G0QQR4_ICHMU|nr:hypothetical protein IMG5_083130 [Ichthyophthirius multifiliis]EGR32435.1 hypothetical protein IMG5_083130 [Ichthyophthirius multifiliis]|eukprot:XP_004036421.1 hypothetical protein IMG5_083130 [Ichthyophthirius multifiliis]